MLYHKYYFFLSISFLMVSWLFILLLHEVPKHNTRFQRGAGDSPAHSFKCRKGDPTGLELNELHIRMHHCLDSFCMQFSRAWNDPYSHCCHIVGGEVKDGRVILKLLLTQWTKLWYQEEKAVGGEGNLVFSILKSETKMGKKDIIRALHHSNSAQHVILSSKKCFKRKHFKIMSPWAISVKS